MTIIRRLLCCLLLAVAVSAQEGVTASVNELLRNKDDATPELVEKIAAAKSREAAQGLVEAYDQVGSLLMRLAIVRGLAELGQVEEAQQAALEKLADIAGNTEQEDLREAAIAGLVRSPAVGKHFLKVIVDSEAADAVRQRALAAHLKLATEDDVKWYREIWRLRQHASKKDKEQAEPPELNAIRELAFEGMLPGLKEEELIRTLQKDPDPKIRRRALERMHEQSMPKTVEVATALLESNFPGADRAGAARILAEREGVKILPTFLDIADQRDTPDDLLVEMARLVNGMRDDATDKKLQKQIGKGKAPEKVFTLLATEGIDDKRVQAAVRKALGDGDEIVRRTAAQIITRRGDREALPDLRKMLDKSRKPGDARIALEAMTALEGDRGEWITELTGYCKSEDRDLRNAAIEVVGLVGGSRSAEILLAALDSPDWSTRLAAIEGLEELRAPAAVPRFVERMAVESGRLKQRLAQALWKLTAQPFEEDAGRWQAWWADAGPTFKVVGEKDLEAAEKAREQRRLTQRTVASPAQFFGIRVESHRVIFVIDVSGSMLEPMLGRRQGKQLAARIDVAKVELVHAIENLEKGALFNILAFSNGVERWQKRGIGTNSDQDRKEALEWVAELRADGATNLFDALQMAFQDPDVDTIFVMSDGEPTSGGVVDPHGIRTEVAFWNKHRNVRINTVAIGGNLEVLEQLAKDSGGRYVEMR